MSFHTGQTRSLSYSHEYRDSHVNSFSRLQRELYLKQITNWGSPLNLKRRWKAHPRMCLLARRASALKVARPFMTNLLTDRDTNALPETVDEHSELADSLVRYEIQFFKFIIYGLIIIIY
jgi:hypothetical protein